MAKLAATGTLCATATASLLLMSCAYTGPQHKEEPPGDDPGDAGGEIFGEEIDSVEIRKDVIAIAFDVNDWRAVMRPGAGREPGEPDQGTGLLTPPMGDNKQRPLPWALTPYGHKVWQGRAVLPPGCANLPATLPQPVHGRWRNPRDIVLEVSPGFHSVFVDDLDCSSAKVDIRKEVQLEVAAGGCSFVGPFPRSTREEVAFTEPKNWSIQPNPVIFGGRLIVPQPPAVCTIIVQVNKKAANWPDEDVIGRHYQRIKVKLISTIF